MAFDGFRSAMVYASWSDHGLHTRGSIEGFERISSGEKWLWCTGRFSASALWNRFAGRQQAKIAGLLQGSECEVTIAILTDDDSPVHLIGTRAWIE